MTELIDADDPSRAEIAAQGGHARAAELERPRNGGNRHRRRNGRNWRGEEGGMTMERHMLDYRTLLEAGACGRALALFRDRYPEGKAEVSAGGCVAVADKFDWDWAASNLLPAAAQDEYDIAAAVANDVYNRAMSAAWAEVMAVALTEVDRADAAAWAAALYGGADAAALIEYNRAKAAAWAQAWLTRQSLSQPQKSILRLFGHWRLWRERQSAAGPSRDRK